MTLDEESLFMPPKSKVDNLKNKVFMKKSEVKVVLYEKDNTIAFQGDKILENKEVCSNLDGG